MYDYEDEVIDNLEETYGAPDAMMLRTLTDLRDLTIQRQRISYENKLRAVDQGTDTASPETYAILTRWVDKFKALEKEASADVRTYARKLPIINIITNVGGVAEITAGQLVSLIDITACPHISSLWKYAGYGRGKYWLKESKEGFFFSHEDQVNNIRRVVVAPEKGLKWIPAPKDPKKEDTGRTEKIQVELRADDPRAGVNLTGCVLMEIRDINVGGWCSVYNKRLKKTLYVIGDCLLKQSEPYNEFYNKCKDYYVKNRPSWKSARCTLSARRRLSKLFLSHLWVVWRTLEGLPVSEPYVIERLGHSHVLLPKDFQWYDTDEDKKRWSARRKQKRAENKANQEAEGRVVAPKKKRKRKM